MLRCAASKKEPKKSVGTLIRGDNESEVIRIEIARNIEGVDLSDFVWSVKYTNSVGQTDICVLDVEEVNSHDIILLWTPGGAATSEPGTTSFEIEGINGERVWQSATQYIEILGDLDGEPNYDPEEMSEVQKLIRFAKDEINALYSASETASAAAATANSAASEADAAAERANEAAAGSDHERVVALEKFAFDPEPYAHTGDILHLDNYENMPMNVVTHIEPVQEGSGDPYPGGGGKNLLPDDKLTIQDKNIRAYFNDPDGFLLHAGMTYTLSLGGTAANAIYVTTMDKAGGDGDIAKAYTKTSLTFTPSKNVRAQFNAYWTNGRPTDAYMMLELGSTATTYAPYSNIRPITGHTGDVLTRCGKNLLDFTAITNKPFGSDPITLTITGSTVELKGTPSAKYRQTVGTLDATGLAGKTVTLSGEVSGDYPYAVCQFKDSEGVIKTTIALTSSGSNTGTVDETCVTANFVMCLNQSAVGEECTATYSNIQLELGSAPTEYEPYRGETFAADFGKNLLPNNATTQTVNGVTFTVNADGSVTANGTATAVAVFAVGNVTASEKGRYVISGCPSGGGNSTYTVRCAIDSVSNDDSGAGTAFEVAGDAVMKCSIIIRSGVTVTNLVFKPMIRRASVADSTYVPYNSSLPGMVYGGELNWNTGVLTVDRAMRTFDGSENWSASGTQFVDFVAFNLTVNNKYHGNNVWTLVLCNAFRSMATSADYQTGRTESGGVGGVGGYGNIVTFKADRAILNGVSGTNSEALDKWKSFLASQSAAGTPVQIVYKLNTPITIQLTPQDILALGGVNTLYAEAGDITVSGRKDILYLTDYLLNKLKSLEKTN